MASPFSGSAQTTTTAAALWAEYADDPDNHSHIPNASYAGYRRGEVPVPEVPVVVNVMDFGAVADGSADNTTAFREAIDAAWAAGGGAVYIPEGTFRIDQIILMHRDGVVLRGAGTGQTVLTFAEPLFNALGRTGHGTQHWNWTGGLIWMGPRDKFSLQANGRWSRSSAAAPEHSINASNWEPWHHQGVITDVTSTHAAGTCVVTVADASGIRAGDLVLLTWINPPGDALWKEFAKDEAFGGNYNFREWLGDTPYFAWPVEVLAVEGNDLHMPQPTRAAILPEYNVQVRRIGAHVRESGVEHLTLLMPNTRETYNYNNGVGWNGIFFNRAFNCWARDVEIINAEHPLHVSSSKNVSVLDIVIENNVQSKYVFTNRVQSHDILYDGFDVHNSVLVNNGINTEFLSTGNVWTRGYMERGTFDNHRFLSFDYLRTDIRLNNPAASRPGGDVKAGPFTGRRGVHWNIEVLETSDRPLSTRGEWVFHPVQFTWGAQIGIRGAPMYTANEGNPWSMPPGDKNMLIGDIGNIPEPANLFDAQVAWRKAMAPWVIPAASTTGFVNLDHPVLAASANPPVGAEVVEVRFYINGDLVGTVAEAPFALDWAGAYPGRHEVFLEMVDTLGGITPSVPREVVFGLRRIIEQDAPDLHYSATGSVLTNSLYSSGTARQLSGGGSVEYAFFGTRVRWVTQRTTQGQTLVASLNGIPVGNPSVDSGGEYGLTGWDSGELPEGWYTLRLETTTNNLIIDHLVVDSTEGGTGAPGTPLPPENLLATSTSWTEVDLAWTRVSPNEDGTHVERSSDGGNTWSTVTLVPGGYSQFTDSGLSPLTPYLYRVAAFNAGGESTPGNVAAVTTAGDVGVPAAPSALQAVSKSATRIDLSWQHVGGAQSFRIERRIGIAPWRVLTTLRGNNLRTFIDLDVDPSLTYEYRVRAINSSGISGASAFVTASPDAGLAITPGALPQHWFVQAPDSTGSVTENTPDRVSVTGATPNRGMVAALSQSIELTEEGDFVELNFATEGVNQSGNFQYLLRFGLFYDNGIPVTTDFSNVTDGSTGFFAALGARAGENGRRSNLIRQGAGTAPILARGISSNGLSGDGLSNLAELLPGNVGDREAVFRISRLSAGRLEVYMQVRDQDRRIFAMVAEVPAANVPTYSFNQLAFLQVPGETFTIKDIVVHTGEPAEPAAPEILVQPESQTVVAGSAFVLAVAVSGSPAPSFQWFRNGVAIEGATSATYFIADADETHSGTYQVEVSNGISPDAISDVAVVSVLSLPVITSQPTAQTVEIGQSVSFSVVAQSDSPLVYQWMKDGEEIPGADGPTLSINAVVAADAGVYAVVVTNAQGSVWSSNAVLTLESNLEALARVNFQPAGVLPPAGWLADTGEAFGDRGNGFSYGWSADNTANAVDRGGSGDVLYRTLNHMQRAVGDAAVLVGVRFGDHTQSDFDDTASLNGIYWNGYGRNAHNTTLTLASAADGSPTDIDFINLETPGFHRGTDNLPDGPFEYEGVRFPAAVLASGAANNYANERTGTLGYRFVLPAALLPENAITVRAVLGSNSNPNTFAMNVGGTWGGSGDRTFSGGATVTGGGSTTTYSFVTLENVAAVYDAESGTYLLDVWFGNIGGGVMALRGLTISVAEAIPDDVPEPAYTWEFALPNGAYEVRIVAGDPAAFDSDLRLDVENTRALEGIPTTDNRWIDSTVQVVVSDGRLTLTNAPGASNNKLSFIEIFVLPETGAPVGFGAWLATQFSEAERADPAISGPAADPTGQGMTNLERYAFGLDADESPSSARPVLTPYTEGGTDYLMIGFLRNEAATDLLIGVEASLDLLDWDNFPGTLEPWGPPAATGRPGVVRDHVRVSLPPSSTGERRAFVRLRVTVLP